MVSVTGFAPGEYTAEAEWMHDDVEHWFPFTGVNLVVDANGNGSIDSSYKGDLGRVVT